MSARTWSQAQTGRLDGRSDLVARVLRAGPAATRLCTPEDLTEASRPADGHGHGRYHAVAAHRRPARR